MLQIYFLYICTGAAAGFFAGLLGIGGGLVVVPLLTLIFSIQGDMSPELAMHVALGTSLSSILFTAVSSSRAHARRKSVLWNYVRGMAPAIALGTLSGSFLAAGMSGAGLKIFFVCFLLVVATQMLMDFYPRARQNAPGTGGLSLAGFAIGGVSSLVGLGGGSLSVPFLRWCGVEIHKAVGTSSALSWPIAIAGSIGYIWTGWDQPGLPAWSLGYTRGTATLGIACTSIFFAPLGARLAHALPVGTLRKVFAVFLYITAARMLWSIIA